MRRTVIISLVAVLMLGAVVPVLAQSDASNAPEGVREWIEELRERRDERRDERIAQRIERIRNRFQETITFWIQAAETVEFLPVEEIIVGEQVEGAAEIGAGCIDTDFEQATNWVLVTVDDASGLPDREVMAILPEGVRERSHIVDVTFVEYCFSETDGQWYAKFDGNLIKHAKAKRLTRLILSRIKDARGRRGR